MSRMSRKMAFIVSKAEQPFGYIQSYLAHRARTCLWPHEQESTIGIDQFIGEVALLGKGLGALMVREFSDWLLTDPHRERVITDPASDNERAIRCYRRAGFHDVHVVETPDGKVLLMERLRPLRFET